MIRVLVVEDSRTVQDLLVHLLEEDPVIRVVGRAGNGASAVELAAELSPDVITMDVVMPDMDGLAATRKIMDHHPTRILVVTAHGDSPELNVAFEALAAGALDVVAKPVGFGPESGEWEAEFIHKVKQIAGLKVRGRK